jgi:hypothetical protein
VAEKRDIESIQSDLDCRKHKCFEEFGDLELERQSRLHAHARRFY